MTYSLPKRRAVVRMLARSEPASGSVMAIAAIASPAIAGARNRRFCSSVPNRETGGVAISAWTATAIPRPPQWARAISSERTTAEK